MSDRPGDLPADVGELLGARDLTGRLEGWAAAARSDAAAQARVRERWLRQVADESATFAGMLVDLAERGTPVVVHGVGGRRHRGVVTGIGVDFVALRTGQNTDVLLAFSGIAAVRAEGGRETPLGDREIHAELALAEALAALAADRPRILVVTQPDPSGTAGELRSVGRDVLTLRLDGDRRHVAYIPIAAVAEVRLA